MHSILWSNHVLAQALLLFQFRHPKPDNTAKYGRLREIMPKSLESRKGRTQINVMDAFLYLLAGSAMLIISISFILWLRF